MVYWIPSFFDDKIYWINNKKDLYYFDGFTAIKELLSDDKRYYSIKVDKQGNRWFSTGKGVYKQDKGNNKVEQILNNINNFSLDIIDETFVDYKGNLWLRLNRKGLIKIRYGKFSSINTLNGLRGKISNTICVNEDGFLLVGFDNGTIDKIKNGKIYDFLSINKTRNARIRHIFKDSRDNFWISTYSGLLKITPSGKEIWFDRNSGLPTEVTRITFEDSNKNIWLGTKSKGIIKIKDDNTIQTFPELKMLEERQVLSINENNEGELMVGTAGNGLFYLKDRTIIKVYNRESAILQFCILG